MEQETTLQNEAVAVEQDDGIVVPAPDRPKKKRKINTEEIYGTVLAGIPLLGFVIFGLVPLFMAFAMGFLNFDRLGWSFDGATWNGFDNFKYVLTDSDFWQSVGNTLIFGTSTFIAQFLALVIAYFLSKDVKGKGAFRVIYFIPYVCSSIALALMWQEIFNPTSGIVNSILGNTDVENGAIQWTRDPVAFYFMVIIMSVWSGMAYGILLYSAALTNVNESMIEAAKIDGAGPFRIFFQIVFPTISPTTFYLVIMGSIGLLQAFATTYSLSGPRLQSLTIVYYMYNYIMGGGDYPINLGIAGAAAWILTIFILAITVIQFIGSKRWVKDD